MRRPRSLLGRLVALVRGALAGWIGDREESHPRAVYEEAIRERIRHYAELKRAVAGILYVRNKLEAEIRALRHELARTGEELRLVVRRGDDGAGLALIRRRRRLEADLERAEREAEAIRADAEGAKGSLGAFREEIRGLEREKARTLVTLADARVRRRAREALEGLSLDADAEALDRVREDVARLRAEGRLDRELDDAGLEGRLRRIRDDAEEEAARRELAECKRELALHVLPARAAPVAVDA